MTDEKSARPPIERGTVIVPLVKSPAPDPARSYPDPSLDPSNSDPSDPSSNASAAAAKAASAASAASAATDSSSRSATPVGDAASARVHASSKAFMNAAAAARARPPMSVALLASYLSATHANRPGTATSPSPRRLYGMTPGAMGSRTSSYRGKRSRNGPRNDRGGDRHHDVRVDRAIAEDGAAPETQKASYARRPTPSAAAAANEPTPTSDRKSATMAVARNYSGCGSRGARRRPRWRRRTRPTPRPPRRTTREVPGEFARVAVERESLGDGDDERDFISGARTERRADGAGYALAVASAPRSQNRHPRAPRGPRRCNGGGGTRGGARRRARRARRRFARG